MIKKNDVILIGSILFFLGTSLKSAHYLLDLYLNATGYPIYIFVLVYLIWLNRIQGYFDKKLLFSIVLYLSASLFLSIYLFLIIISIYLILFLIYSLKKSESLEFVDSEIYSLPMLVSKNKNFFSLKTIVLASVSYYFILVYLYSFCHCLNVIGIFW